MKRELISYVRSKFQLRSAPKNGEPREVQAPLRAFSTQPESIIPEVHTVLKPILMGSNSIGEEGFQRLSTVTLRNHLRDKLGEARDKAEQAQNPNYEDSEHEIGQGWEVQRNMSFYSVPPTAQSYVWFPSLHEHEQNWSVHYIGFPEPQRDEQLRIVVGDKKLGTRNFMGLDIPNDLTIDFRFIKDAHGNDEFIEIVLNNTLFVLDKTGTMLGADIIGTWAAAHGWKPASQDGHDPVAEEIEAFFGSVTAIGGRRGSGASEIGQPKAIE